MHPGKLYAILVALGIIIMLTGGYTGNFIMILSGAGFIVFSISLSISALLHQVEGLSRLTIINNRLAVAILKAAGLAVEGEEFEPPQPRK